VSNDEIVAAAAIAGANTFVHKILPEPLHVPANLALAGFVTALAVHAGANPDDLGLASANLANGVRIGLFAAAAVAGGVAGAARFDHARPLFVDERVAGYSRARSAYEIAVRIPFGTALAEEMLFRGALPALLARRHSRASTILVSNTAFGVWHVIPTLASLDTSAVAARVPASTSARVGTVAGIAAATAIAGLAFNALQRRSGSVIAPILVHAALYIAAFATTRAVANAGPPRRG